jgi:hypothetical protein
LQPRIEALGGALAQQSGEFFRKRDRLVEFRGVPAQFR